METIKQQYEKPIIESYAIIINHLVCTSGGGSGTTTEETEDDLLP